MISMFKDIDLSKDIAGKFNASNKNAVEGIEIESVQILSQGSWPINIQQAVKVQYPTSMKMLYEKFENYYKMNYHNKTLHMLN